MYFCNLILLAHLALGMRAGEVRPMHSAHPVRGVGTHLLLIEVHGIVYRLPSDLSKYGVLAVKMVTAVHCDEELAVVGVGCILICASHETPIQHRCSVCGLVHIALSNSLVLSASLQATKGLHSVDCGQ